MGKQSQKDIWDVMFSLDRSNFPLSRNYLQQPRGSSNPINSQVIMEPKQEYLDFAGRLNPVNLYALDFELNFASRKIADVIALSHNHIYDGDFFERFPKFNDGLIRLVESCSPELKNVLRFESISCYIISVIQSYNESILSDNVVNEYEPLKNFDINPEMRELAQLQFSLEYHIEHSDMDWRTKAEAFLRSHYYNDFKLCDNETLIHISKKDFLELGSSKKNSIAQTSYSDIKNRAINEGYLRWSQYRERWDLIALNYNNPFEGEPDDLSSLRFSDISCIRYLHKLIYNSKNDNPSTPQNITEFCHLLNNFRTDMSAIKVNIPSIYEHLKHSLSLDENICPYEDITSSNYVLSVEARMSCVIFFFITGRLLGPPHDKKQYDFYSHLLLTNPCFEGHDVTFIDLVGDSSNDDKQDMPWLSLVCFNVLAIGITQPKKYVEEIETFFEIIRENQSSYGYWYDCSVCPEFMTVLALDALDIGTGNFTFTSNKIKLSECRLPLNTPQVNSDEENEAEPYVEFDFLSRVLTVGGQTILLSTTRLELMGKLIAARYLTGYPPEISKSYKYAVDFIRKQLKHKHALKYIIKSTYTFSYSDDKKKKIRVYELAPNVIVKNMTSAKTVSAADMDSFSA